MSKRKLKRINYKEQTVPRLSKRRNPTITTVYTVPADSEDTLYEEFANAGMEFTFSDVYEWIPFKIKRFVIYNRQAGIESLFRTKEGSATNIILLREWHREHYLHLLPQIGCNVLVDKKWMKQSQLDAMKLPPTHTAKFGCNASVWCTLLCHDNNEEYKLVIDGIIEAVKPHVYALQLSPQFKFKPNNPSLIDIANKWVFTAQLSVEKPEWTQIGISEIQIEEMRYLISIECKKSIQSELIFIMPRDLSKHSAYYGKPNIYHHQKQILMKSFGCGDLIQNIALNLLQDLIFCSFALCPKSSSILTFSMKRRVTSKSLMMYGSYIQENVMDVGLLQMATNSKMDIRFLPSAIKVKANANKLKEIAINILLKCDKKKGNTELFKDIEFVYSRKPSRIMITKFRFDTKSQKRLQRDTRRDKRRKKRRR